MLLIENDGQKIVSTNYWESEHANRGAIFLSANASAFRLLIPTAHEGALTDMRDAREVIVSRGPWIEYGQTDAIEIMFEDGGPNPFVLLLSSAQIDRMPAKSDEGRSDLKCSVWVKGPRTVLELPARYRRVKRIPCLAPWMGSKK